MSVNPIRMRNHPNSLHLLLLVIAIAATQTLPGYAHLRGDSGAREGAWGLAFRCSTSNRTEILRLPSAHNSDNR